MRYSIVIYEDDTQIGSLHLHEMCNYEGRSDYYLTIPGTGEYPIYGHKNQRRRIPCKLLAKALKIMDKEGENNG